MNEPLVSIIVITYNSSKYILETLESCKAQTYKNIELIISDDGSADGTLQICQDWLDINQNEFVNTKLVTVKKNTGIPANCNRGVKASNGDWIKTIAGDDLLSKETIETYVTYVLANKHILFLFSDIILIDDNGVFLNNIYKKYLKWTNKFKLLKPDDQFDMLLKGNKAWAVSWFFKIEVFNRVGGFDERYHCYEDRPFIIKATSLGIKIHHLDFVSVLHRKSDTSVQKNNNILSCFEESKLKYFIENHEKEILQIDKYKNRLIILNNLKLIFKNKPNHFTKIVLRVLLKFKVITPFEI